MFWTPGGSDAQRMITSRLEGSRHRYERVGWFQICATDMPRAKRLYESIFEQQLDKLDS
jgi:hypothetical protein